MICEKSARLSQWKLVGRGLEKGLRRPLLSWYYSILETIDVSAL